MIPPATRTLATRDPAADEILAIFHLDPRGRPSEKRARVGGFTRIYDLRMRANLITPGIRAS